MIAKKKRPKETNSLTRGANYERQTDIMGLVQYTLRYRALEIIGYLSNVDLSLGVVPEVSLLISHCF